MLWKLALPEIRELIDEGDTGTLAEVLNRWHPADVAGIIEDLPLDRQEGVLRLLNAPLAASTFEYLARSHQENLIRSLGATEASAILNDMAPDDRTALLAELPEAISERLLSLLSPREKVVARALLDYPEGSVGRLMTPDLVAVERDWTIDRVLDHVRKHGRDSETLNILYVTDAEGRLIDELRIREILLSRPEAVVADLMKDRLVYLSTTDDKQAAVEVFRKYDRTALPVVNEQGILVGIVTIDDVLDVAEEQATRELQLFGGVEALDEPYVATPFLSLLRKRASWLILLFLGEMLTATAMGFFEKEIAKAVVLALFVPLIISSGGNSGSQAATLVIRALALGEVKLRDWWMVMRRELAAGLLLGSALGTIGFLRIALWSSFSNMYGPHWVLVGATVALSLVGVVIWGTLSGSMLPFLLSRLGFDPATSSAPFVATLVDVTGLVIYFTVASLVLHGTML